MTAFTVAPVSNRPFAFALICAAFGMLFLFHIYPIGLGDVYWHLNTGRWIWEHGALPDSDPFSYALGDALDAKQQLIAQGYWQRLILQGFWLAQLLFFGTYAAFGPWGLVILKSALFVMLYWLVWRSMIKDRVNPLLSLLAIIIMPWMLYRYDELRPQIFSFIGVVLVYTNISHSLAKLRSGITRPGALIALPFIMFLWANLHPGYMLGWVIIIVMLAGISIDQWRGVNRLERRALKHLYMWLGLALIASMLNPLSDVLFSYFGIVRNQFVFGVDEHLPLYNYAKMYHQPLLFYGALTLALVTLGVLIQRRRHVDTAQALLLSGFTFAGFYAFRFTIFFILMAILIGLPHISALLELYITKVRAFYYAILLCALLGLGYLSFQQGIRKLEPVETTYVPEHAADFVLGQHPPAPLFNAYEYGGYLGWRLTPEYRVFVDPRCLDQDVQNAYQIARGGHYQGVFEKYGVNSVVFYLFTPVVHSIPEITLYLLMDKQWDLVYADRLSVVMVRHDRNMLPVIGKAPLLDYLQRVLERKLATAPQDTQAHVQYGRVLLYRGNVEGAKEHFGTALQINPKLRSARLYLDTMNLQNK